MIKVIVHNSGYMDVYSVTLISPLSTVRSDCNTLASNTGFCNQHGRNVAP